MKLLREGAIVYKVIPRTDRSGLPASNVHVAVYSEASPGIAYLPYAKKTFQSRIPFCFAASIVCGNLSYRVFQRAYVIGHSRSQMSQKRHGDSRYLRHRDGSLSHSFVQKQRSASDTAISGEFLEIINVVIFMRDRQNLIRRSIRPIIVMITSRTSYIAILMFTFIFVLDSL